MQFSSSSQYPSIRLFRYVAFLVINVVGAEASDRVIGEEVGYTSPNGAPERCVRITRMAGAKYHKGDAKDEEGYSEIDFYAINIALCPKTWSTSPGMIIYDISEGAYAGDRNGFESNACIEGKLAKAFAKDELAVFKPSMNQPGTSATFSASSLLYYHFSRFFDMEARVPVAVWRSMDRSMHLTRVARPGLSISQQNPGAKMNQEAWQILADAGENPQIYVPTDDVYSADRGAIYGVLLSNKGSRYGSEVNGTRKSSWGTGQNMDFQETPAFLALRSAAPLQEAIVEGIELGCRDPQIAEDIGDSAAAVQMVYWMREISEIVLMDFIFSQQDRVGNIDFEAYYYWEEDGKVERKRTKSGEPGDGVVPEGAILLKRTMLNDNDAGGRVEYANFAKSTQMLEKLRHFYAGTYRQLIVLDADLQAQGALFHYIRSSFGLDEAQVQQIVDNTSLAMGILRDSCRRGDLRFDLDPEKFFLEGDAGEEPVDCGESQPMSAPADPEIGIRPIGDGKSPAERHVETVAPPPIPAARTNGLE